MNLFVVLSLFTASLLPQDAPVKIVTLGDSITAGSRPGVGVHQTFASLLQKELTADKIKVDVVDVVNVGIGGERTDQALKRLNKVIQLKPKFVTIMYGTNDSYVDRGAKDSRLAPEDYRKNLTKIVSELRSAGVTPILMTEPRWGDKANLNGLGEHPNVRLERYVKICRAVAEETKTPLVDHFAHWTKQNANGVDVGGWTTDQCHPNPRGHEELTKLILPVLQQAMRGK